MNAFVAIIGVTYGRSLFDTRAILALDRGRYAIQCMRSQVDMLVAIAFILTKYDIIPSVITFVGSSNILWCHSCGLLRLLPVWKRVIAATNAPIPRAPYVASTCHA